MSAAKRILCDWGTYRSKRGQIAKRCRKTATQAVLVEYEWGQRVDMQKGMVPCCARAVEFSCDVHASGVDPSFLCSIARYQAAQEAV